jgi:hypothetical protein
MAPDESETRTARKDGREIATMRCAALDGLWMVECDVYPVEGMRVEPLRPGPYRFATRAEADAFMKEASLALTYLGCDVAATD